MNPQGEAPIDPDIPTTWPAVTRDGAEKHAERLVGTTEFLCDLSISLEQEDDFRQTFGIRKIVAYHNTRLLPHEADAIRLRGLRVLDEQLVRERITDAVAHEALPVSARRAAEEGNIYAVRNIEGREGKICFIVGRSVFDEDAGGCDASLRFWGGEAIRGGPVDDPALATIGTASIVVAALNLTRPHNKPYSWPELAKLFVGSLLGLDCRYTEVYYPDPVPGCDICAIWQPGHQEYDRHIQLPR